MFVYFVKDKCWESTMVTLVFPWLQYKKYIPLEQYCIIHQKRETMSCMFCIDAKCEMIARFTNIKILSFLECGSIIGTWCICKLYMHVYMHMCMYSILIVHPLHEEMLTRTRTTNMGLWMFLTGSLEF